MGKRFGIEAIDQKQIKTKIKRTKKNGYIYDTANRYTSDRLGISVPFPNYEEEDKDENKNR